MTTTTTKFVDGHRRSARNFRPRRSSRAPIAVERLSISHMNASQLSYDNGGGSALDGGDDDDDAQKEKEASTEMMIMAKRADKHQKVVVTKQQKQQQQQRRQRHAGGTREDNLLQQQQDGQYVGTDTTMDYGSDNISKVRVTLEDGTVLEATAVICTLPLGILQIPPHQRGHVSFHPPLPPPKMDAIQSLGFGLYNKCALLFDYIFWQNSPNDDDNNNKGNNNNGNENKTPHFFGNASTYHNYQKGDKNILFCNMAAVHGKPVIVMMFGGSYAKEMQSYTDQQVVKECCDILQEMFFPNYNTTTAAAAATQHATWPTAAVENGPGSAAAASASASTTATATARPKLPLEPIDYVVTRWGMEQYSRGAFVHIPPGVDGPAALHTISEPIYEDVDGSIGYDNMVGNDDNRDGNVDNVWQQQQQQRNLFQNRRRPLILFAGEHTTPYHPSTIHGAYLSGIREAMRLDLALEPALNNYQSFEEGCLYQRTFRVKRKYAVPPEERANTAAASGSGTSMKRKQNNNDNAVAISPRKRRRRKAASVAIRAVHKQLLDQQAPFSANIGGVAGGVGGGKTGTAAKNKKKAPPPSLPLPIVAPSLSAAAKEAAKARGSKVMGTRRILRKASAASKSLCKDNKDNMGNADNSKMTEAQMVRKRENVLLQRGVASYGSDSHGMKLVHAKVLPHVPLQTLVKRYKKMKLQQKSRDDFSTNSNSSTRRNDGGVTHASLTTTRTTTPTPTTAVPWSKSAFSSWVVESKEDDTHASTRISASGMTTRRSAREQQPEPDDVAQDLPPVTKNMMNITPRHGGRRSLNGMNPTTATGTATLTHSRAKGVTKRQAAAATISSSATSVIGSASAGAVQTSDGGVIVVGTKYDARTARLLAREKKRSPVKKNTGDDDKDGQVSRVSATDSNSGGGQGGGGVGEKDVVAMEVEANKQTGTSSCSSVILPGASSISATTTTTPVSSSRAVVVRKSSRKSTRKIVLDL